jgi:hypothetical protein
MNKRTEIVKPFEFSLSINEHIICQRYFSVKNYNNDCRESLEIKDMIDDIIGTNQDLQLGLIPEFFKHQCIENSYKPWHSQNNHLFDKDDDFTLTISKNNVNQLRGKDGQFNIDDLQKEVIATAILDGKLFHPHVRYNVDIRSIIPDIIRTIQKYMSFRTYATTFGDVQLTRLNKLTPSDMEKINQD